MSCTQAWQSAAQAKLQSRMACIFMQIPTAAHLRHDVPQQVAYPVRTALKIVSRLRALKIHRSKKFQGRPHGIRYSRKGQHASSSRAGNRRAAQNCAKRPLKLAGSRASERPPPPRDAGDGRARGYPRNHRRRARASQRAEGGSRRVRSATPPRSLHHMKEAGWRGDRLQTHRYT